MNALINKSLFAGDKLMSEMHLKQSRFRYNVCGPFTKNEERIQKFQETGDSRYIYKNKLEEVCFQHIYCLWGIYKFSKKIKYQLLIKYYVINY